MYIIAEAGLNFGGSVGDAYNYCKTAKDIGADAIKFQITDVKKTWKKNTNEYKNIVKKSFGEIDLYSFIESCEFNDSTWIELKEYCDKIGIEFIATPSTVEKMELLIDMGCKKIKISSDRAEQPDIIKKAKISNRIEFIISTGIYQVYYPWAKMMYCISDYPTVREKVDFNLMKNYHGFSDHTLEFNKEWVENIQDSGVEYYEKHIKLNDKCIDAKNSLNPDQFRILIDRMRGEE